MTLPEKVLLDCDRGHDDAFAIVLAAGAPAVELLAITTVAGNQTIEKVTRNALAVCEVAGIDEVPVAAGASHPLVRDPLIAPDIHGDSGLDGPTLPRPRLAVDPRHGVDVIVQTIMTHQPGTVSLVATGPLTNVALAMRREPAIVGRVKRVVLMGGAYTRGITPAAEFNILADAEAAAAVFSGDWDVTMVGLDVTHQARATTEVLARIADVGSDLSHFLVDVLEFFARSYREAQGFDTPPVHDPVCIAALIDPAVLETSSAFVTVETAGRWTYGMTVTDFGDAYGAAHNTRVATALDTDRFWQLVIDAVRTLSVEQNR